jgi:hypothetical protein
VVACIVVVDVVCVVGVVDVVCGVGVVGVFVVVAVVVFLPGIPVVHCEARDLEEGICVRAGGCLASLTSLILGAQACVFVRPLGLKSTHDSSLCTIVIRGLVALEHETLWYTGLWSWYGRL